MKFSQITSPTFPDIEYFIEREIVPLATEFSLLTEATIMEDARTLNDAQVISFFAAAVKVGLAKKEGLDPQAVVINGKSPSPDGGSNMSKLELKLRAKVEQTLKKASMVKIDPKEAAQQFKAKAQAILKKYGTKEGIQDTIRELVHYAKNNKKKIAIALAIVAIGASVGMVAGPWAARLTSFVLKAGVSYFSNNGKIDWKTIVMGAALGAAAGEVTHVISAITNTDITPDVSGDFHHANAMMLHDATGGNTEKFKTALKAVIQDKIQNGNAPLAMQSSNDLIQQAMGKAYGFDVTHLDNIGHDKVQLVARQMLKGMGYQGGLYDNDFASLGKAIGVDISPDGKWPTDVDIGKSTKEMLADANAGDSAATGDIKAKMKELLVKASNDGKSPSVLDLSKSAVAQVYGIDPTSIVAGSAEEKAFTSATSIFLHDMGIDNAETAKLSQLGKVVGVKVPDEITVVGGKTKYGPADGKTWEDHDDDVAKKLGIKVEELARERDMVAMNIRRLGLGIKPEEVANLSPTSLQYLKMVISRLDDSPDLADKLKGLSVDGIEERAIAASKKAAALVSNGDATKTAAGLASRAPTNFR